MDEITERPRTRSLPAPTGPRAPTGPVPLTLPDGTIPPPVAAQPVVPYLPAVAAKVTAPTTGPVATTLLSTAAQIEFELRKTVVEPPKRRRRKLLIVLGVIVMLPMLLGVIFRNSAFVGRFTGKGYDTNPLPVASFPPRTKPRAPRYSATTRGDERRRAFRAAAGGRRRAGGSSTGSCSSLERRPSAARLDLPYAFRRPTGPVRDTSHRPRTR